MIHDHLSHRVVVSPTECEGDNADWHVVNIGERHPETGRSLVAVEADDRSFVLFASPEAVERFALTLYLAISSYMEEHSIPPFTLA